MTDSARRRFLTQAALLAAASGAGGRVAWASPRPLRILVGFPPGGGSDVIARLLQEPLSRLLGAPVIVDNRPGAGGQIAAQYLKAAQPDGTTVFLTHDHTISILPQVIRHPGFDPDQDFVPAGGFASFVNCLAVPGTHPARSLADYVQWVRTVAHGRSAIGIPAPASTPEFLVQQLGRHFQLDLVAAPYKGSAPMLGDLMGRQIEAGIGSVQDFVEYHHSGKLRVLAVLGAQRQKAFPQVPTLAELGLPGFEDLPYYGFYAPKGTFNAWIQRFSLALAEVVTRPQIRAQLEQLGLTVEFMNPQQLHEREHRYTAAWKAIIQSSGFQPQ